VRTADLAQRDALIAHLKAKGILAVFHYVPLHSSPHGRTLAGGDGELPVTDAASSSLLRLPMYYDMSEADVTDVATAIHDFYGSTAPA
jgi:dTDP-4-amino-4,6-dideoxygalactose transaminase